jgi:hypothetical protein
MLFYRAAASHYAGLVGTTSGARLTWFWIIALVITAAVELNALVGLQGGTKKPLDTVSGALWSGFILAAIFYLLFLIFF